MYFNITQILCFKNKFSALKIQIFYFKNTFFILKTLVAKPAETNFEQGLLSIFDCRKVINYIQSQYYFDKIRNMTSLLNMFCQQIDSRN